MARNYRCTDATVTSSVDTSSTKSSPHVSLLSPTHNHKTMNNGKKYLLSYIIDGKKTEPMTLNYDGDIFIEMQEQFGNDDFAFEMLAWAEQAKPGDHYEDEDIIIDVQKQ